MSSATTHDRLGAIVADARARHPVEASVELRFADCGIRIDSNSHELIDGLRTYYAEFLGPQGDAPIVVTALEGAPPDLTAETFARRPLEPGKTRLKEEYLELDGGRVVRKVLTGMHFFMRGDDHVGIGPCRANDNQIVNFVNNRHIQWLLHRGSLLTHAAAVHVDGRGLAMAGFSGMGKSTLALHLMSRGVNFVSNDRVIVREHDGALRMHGVAKHPRINPGTALNNPDLTHIMTAEERARFSALPVDELWNLEHKYDALIDECFGAHRFQLDAALDGFVILNWHRDGGAMDFHEVDLDERRDLLRAVMKPTGLFYRPLDGGAADPDEDEYVERLRGCTVFEASGGADFDAAADACMEFLRAGP